MAVSKKRVKVGSCETFDTQLIYSRVMGLMSSRNIELKEVFHFELAPIPTSIFQDNGSMRAAARKFILKDKLKVEQSARTIRKPEITIMDGCAILWIIHWPSQGIVQDFIDGFIGYIMDALFHGDIYLVFDRYYYFSIKSGTRNCRAGEQLSRHHKLTSNTPLPPQHVIFNCHQK
jgi:hypothetical protein